MSLLEIKNVKKNFGGVEVLKDISLKVDKGEVLGIIGPSGSGKSTFLRSLNLLEVAQQDLRHRMMEKSIMMEHLDLCFRISICFHIIRL